MDPNMAIDASKSLISNGVLGVAVIGLVYFILMLRAELKDVRTNHKVEIAAKDALILELQEKRLVESQQGYQIASSVTSTLNAYLAATQRGVKP